MDRTNNTHRREHKCVYNFGRETRKKTLLGKPLQMGGQYYNESPGNRRKSMERIYLPEDKFKLPGVVKTVMNFRLHKILLISSLAEQLQASQEKPCFMELVSQLVEGTSPNFQTSLIITLCFCQLTKVFCFVWLGIFSADVILLRHTPVTGNRTMYHSTRIL